MKTKTLLLLLLTSAATAKFDAQGAAHWALGCVNNCNACTCQSGGGGASEGYCQFSKNCPMTSCSCGCTPFVSTAMKIGGGWKGAFQAVCANFYSFADSSPHWTRVTSIQPGDLVAMSPPTDPHPLGHCCIGTGAGTISCHNHAEKNIQPIYHIDGIFRHVESIYNEVNSTALLLHKNVSQKYPKTNFITSAKVVNSTVGSLTSVQSTIQCEVCQKVMGKAISIILKHACGLTTRTLGLVACEVAGFGPEDPGADACAIIFEASCNLLATAIKDGTRDPSRLCDLVHLC